MLIWKGKILEMYEPQKGHWHYVCEFSCETVTPFIREICQDLLVNPPPKLQVGDEVTVPMAWVDENGKEYDLQQAETNLSSVPKLEC